jgi:hypothetical protein
MSIPKRYKGCAECEDQDLVHVDYPHDPGYLLGCDACEDHCHCTDDKGVRIKGRAACVFADCGDYDDDVDDEDLDQDRDTDYYDEGDE